MKTQSNWKKVSEFEEQKVVLFLVCFYNCSSSFNYDIVSQSFFVIFTSIFMLRRSPKYRGRIPCRPPLTGLESDGARDKGTQGDQ